MKLSFVCYICIMKHIYSCAELGCTVYFSLWSYLKNFGSCCVCLALWCFVYRFPWDGDITLANEMSREFWWGKLDTVRDIRGDSSLKSTMQSQATVLCFIGCCNISTCFLKLRHQLANTRGSHLRLCWTERSEKKKESGP